jgi:hypothetical protein
MTHLYKKALIKADEIRAELGLNMFQAVNVYDACIHLGISVRFLDINMEGMYVKQEGGTNPTILISNQRPFPRRAYSCAHELGHHVFGHGFKIDALSESGSEGSNDADEFLVDCFAGSFLMPIAGIQAEFTKRNWVISKSSPIDFFTVCSVFGTGYQTMITHCKANGLISSDKAITLSKLKPSTILKSIISADISNSYFKIIDRQPQLALIDLEVTNYIILPEDILIEGDHLKKIKETNFGTAYQAVKPGIVRVYSVNGTFNSFVRIQNILYSGLAEYRHLENIND